jgi:hypothetical protein
LIFCEVERNCRSLGFARDDKGEGSAYLGSCYRGWTEPQEATRPAILSATNEFPMEAPPDTCHPDRSEA